MKFACRLCWDRGCNCTQEELAEYDRKLKEASKEVHKPKETSNGCGRILADGQWQTSCGDAGVFKQTLN